MGRLLWSPNGRIDRSFRAFHPRERLRQQTRLLRVALSLSKGPRSLRFLSLTRWHASQATIERLESYSGRSSENQEFSVNERTLVFRHLASDRAANGHLLSSLPRRAWPHAFCIWFPGCLRNYVRPRFKFHGRKTKCRRVATKDCLKRSSHREESFCLLSQSPHKPPEARRYPPGKD